MKDRREKILLAIINSYILQGEPIGSKSLASDYSFDVSPATIRNDMNALEKNGFLKKAHTSSGRMPSDKGYRLFVDYILDEGIEGLSRSIDSDSLKSLLDKRYNNANDIVETATKTLAKITNLTAVSVTLKNSIKILVNIELMRITENILLLIAVFDNGTIIHDKIILEESISDEALGYINNIFKAELIGCEVSNVDKTLDNLKESFLNVYSSVIDAMANRITSNSNTQLDKKVTIEGLSNIFNFKEFDDLAKAKEFIKLFDKKDLITELLTDKKNEGLIITIGEENEIDQFKENTIITSYFKVDNQTIGQIGIVGLTRINYREVISSIKLISDLLNE